MVRLLRPPCRDQGNRTRERPQKTLVGLRESFLPAAPGLKAHLEAELPARPVPLPGHCRLPPRLVLPAQVGMMASAQQHSPVRLAVAALHTKQSARNPMLLEQHCPPRDRLVAAGEARRDPARRQAANSVGLIGRPDELDIRRTRRSGRDRDPRGRGPEHSLGLVPTREWARRLGAQPPKRMIASWSRSRFVWTEPNTRSRRARRPGAGSPRITDQRKRNAKTADKP